MSDVKTGNGSTDVTGDQAVKNALEGLAKESPVHVVRRLLKYPDLVFNAVRELAARDPEVAGEVIDAALTARLTTVLGCVPLKGTQLVPTLRKKFGLPEIPAVPAVDGAESQDQ